MAISKEDQQRIQAKMIEDRVFFLDEKILNDDENADEKKQLLSALECSEDSQLFKAVLQTLALLKPHVLDFYHYYQNKKPISKQQEKFSEVITPKAEMLLRLLTNEVQRNQDLIEQLYKINCLNEHNKLPNISALDSLQLLTNSLKEMYTELSPTGDKKKFERTIVKELLPVLKKHGFPTSKNSTRLHELLRISFVLLKVDCDVSFENIVKTVNQELKREELSRK